ncbi:tetrapyrrole biosynthesis, uroporphyrinogen III synthase [Schizophyllum amplum]|uniref:Tetrapyrrole biosynthesis, uroporphyrinogen III synthase n=1 Tax=Schizophyllum amplum TaxID=97359 RepID=A0A550CLK8_9AGAR|nr:tetrapyrrole biosynthesis, uroporphyrinogen III synthase [Auriculariopsis ampla]
MASLAVLLLRDPDREKPDRYESAFLRAGHVVTSVAALDTGFVNEDALRCVVQKRASDFDGVIVTSSRACEAWRRAAQGLYPDAATPSFPRPQNGWATTPFYAVGRATSVALRAIAGSPAAPRDVRGEESSTGETLARFVVDDVRAGDATRGHPARLLYLTGDKNRDTVPNMLTEAGIAFEPLQVYGTRGAPDFAQRLEDAMSAFSTDSGELWVVFFAPSSTDFALPVLRQHIDFKESPSVLSSGSSTEPSTRRYARVAAIGPMSSDHILRERNLYVDAIATNPSPADLVNAIHAVTLSRPP